MVCEKEKKKEPEIFEVLADPGVETGKIQGEPNVSEVLWQQCVGVS